MDIARHYGPNAVEPLPEGTYPWFEKTVHPRFVNTGARFQAPSVLHVKLMTGTDKYDHYLNGRIGGYAGFLLDGNLDELTADMEKAGHTLRTRWPFLTTEAALTDRMVVPGFQDMCFAYTGGNPSTLHHGLPSYPVTYEDTTKNFAALVRSHSDTELSLWIYSFLPEDKEIGIRLWRLQVGGKYQLSLGPDSDQDGTMDEAPATKDFALEHRGDSVRFVLPARKLQLVQVKQTAPPAPQPKYLPDLGISDEDVFWLNDRELAVRVHNIGSLPAENIRITLSAANDPEEKIGEAVISFLNAPLSLDPQTRLLAFPVDPALRDSPLLFSIDPDDEIPEITERNNSLQLIPQ